MAESLSDRVRYLARHYHELQGLIAVPLALYVLAQMAWERDLLTWLPRSDRLDAGAYGLLGLGLTAIFMLGIRAEYRRHYGQVKPLVSPEQRAAYWAKIIVVYVFLGIVSREFGWRIDLGWLMLSSVMFYSAFAEEVRRPAYLVTGILMVIGAVLPLALHGAVLRDLEGALVVLVLLVSGLLNHHWFVKTCDAIRCDAAEHAQAV